MPQCKKQDFTAFRLTERKTLAGVYEEMIQCTQQCREGVRWCKMTLQSKLKSSAAQHADASKLKDVYRMHWFQTEKYFVWYSKAVMHSCQSQKKDKKESAALILQKQTLFILLLTPFIHHCQDRLGLAFLTTVILHPVNLTPKAGSLPLSLPAFTYLTNILLVNKI